MAQVQLQPNVTVAQVAPAIAAQTTATDSDVGAAGASGGTAQLMMTSLYVGDLDFNITDTDLFDRFKPYNVVSVRICRDIPSQRSLGYGYLNFANPQDASDAIKNENYAIINGKSIRIMYSNRDPNARRNEAGNIFIKNLDKDVDNKELNEKFSPFGNIMSCKVVKDTSGQSRGYGFVQYDDAESAKRAIEKLNGTFMNDKQIYVGPFIRRQERENSVDKTKFNNVYVKNLSESTKDEDLKMIFGEYGTITSAVVMRDSDGKSKCFGFVNFENPDDAAKAVEALNGQKFNDKEWYVGKAQKKAEREAELKLRYEQSMKESVDKYQGANLYVKNLDDTVDDVKLREFFSPFGTITSCKVMRDPNGTSKGSGFVAFATADEASRALLELNGKMIVSKPLYVALAQRKEDRRARLQAQFSQMRPMVMPPSVSPQMPMYSPGNAALGQQLYYGQGPAMIPPQPAFGYQHQLLPGVRPGLAPVPNFFVPMGRQGQPGQRAAGGRRPVQQPLPVVQQQMLLRGRFGYPEARSGGPDVQMHGTMDQEMLPSGIRIPGGVGGSASFLADTTPDKQRVILGENLYPLVEELEPKMAAKVTGMLLEMDQTEVLHLIESPDALRAKVAEAMEVLRNVAQHPRAPSNSPPVNQLAGLSLQDNLS